MAKLVFIHNVREHLGLEYLSAVLKKEGHNVHLIYDPGLFSYNDNALYSPLLERVFDRSSIIIKKVLEINPDIVGFSVYTTNYAWVKSISSLIKSKLNVPIIFGGIHSTFFPEKVMRDSGIDFVIRGEAEGALSELMESLNNKRAYKYIDNLCYRDGHSIVINKLRPLIRDLDSLPFPDKELFSGYVEYISYMILTQRGCVFNCSFCCEASLRKLYKRSFYRKRSVNSVIEELKLALSKYNYKEVIFFDSDFLIDKKWVKEFLPIYKRVIRKPFKFMCRIRSFDEDMAALVKDSGCYDVNFGIQSWNEDVRMRLLNRRETNEQIKKMLYLCEKYHLNYDIDLIFNIPGDTRKDYLRGLGYMRDCRFLNRVKCFKLAYFPMAELTKKFYREGLISNKDIKNIVESGCYTDTVHKSLDLNKIFYKDIETFFKIFPLLSPYVRGWMMKNHRYDKLRFIPPFLVYFLQTLFAFKRKDWRFLVYWQNFLKRIKWIFSYNKDRDILKRKQALDNKSVRL